MQVAAPVAWGDSCNEVRQRDCASDRLGLGLMIDTQAVTARAKSHCQCLGA